MPLLDDVKIRLEIPATDTTYDVLLLDLINEVKAEADSYMGLAYTAAKDVTEYFDGGRQELWLSYANVSNVVVEVDGSTVSSDDYAVDSERGIIRSLSGAWIGDELYRGGVRSIKVTYDGGYDEDDLPADLRGKLIKQVCYEFRRRRDPGLSAVSYPDGSVQKYSVDEWLPDVLRVLGRRGRVSL